MKQYNLRILTTPMLTCMLMASIFLNLSCRKDKTPEPSDLDKNYFVVSDNPNDPADHAIYEFYKSTGIASFYNDTIYKKQVSAENVSPVQYAYIKLSLDYTPLGNKAIVFFKPLPSRNKIPGLLNLLQTEIIPRLPSSGIIPSILLVDTLAIPYPIVNFQISHGWTAIFGFNTVGITVKEVEAMNTEERKMYAASILAGIAVKKIDQFFPDQLEKDFFSVSRDAVKSLLPIDIYSGFPYMYLVPPNLVPIPQNIGLLFHPTFIVGETLLESTPRESDDIRAFLTAAFYYTNQEFADLYPGKTLLLKKFSVIRNLAKEAGFKIPD